MKIGLQLRLTDYSLDPAALAKKAEELGFESIWVPDHPIIPVSTNSHPPNFPTGPIPDFFSRMVDPFIALARASAVTQTIKLGTGICLVPERNPLLVAKEVATLDHLSGGRVVFGVGVGWLKEESEIMGGDFPHRWTQARDGVLAMKELWTEEEAEYHGKYYDFPPVRSFPKPVQKPHPPILLGGNARNVFKRIVEWADGWLPSHQLSIEELKRGRDTINELAEQAGRDPRSIEVLAHGGVEGQYRDRKQIMELEEAGMSGLIISLIPCEGDEAIADMEEIALQVLP